MQRRCAQITLDLKPRLVPQVGVTPEGIEKPRCLADPDSVASVSQQPEEHRATLPEGPDAKWRFFWRVGPRPQQTQFPELNADPVIPAGSPLQPLTLASKPLTWIGSTLKTQSLEPRGGILSGWLGGLQQLSLHRTLAIIARS